LLSASLAASFLLTSFLIEITPGPNMTYLALVSASEGRRAGFATVAGITLGLGTIGLIAAFGVAELIQASPLIYELLRWGGVLFLFYLAWDGWRSASTLDDSSSHGKYFVRGLVTNLLNPKAGIFYVAVLPRFMDVDNPTITQAIVLTAVYVGVATVVHMIIVVLAGSLEPVLNDPRREQLARRVLSGLLALVAIWFAWTTS